MKGMIVPQYIHAEQNQRNDNPNPNHNTFIRNKTRAPFFLHRRAGTVHSADDTVALVK